MAFSGIFFSFCVHLIANIRKTLSVKAFCHYCLKGLEDPSVLFPFFFICAFFLISVSCMWKKKNKPQCNNTGKILQTLIHYIYHITTSACLFTFDLIVFHYRAATEAISTKKDYKLQPLPLFLLSFSLSPFPPFPGFRSY